ncbi:VCBS repeat-containing protein [Winogradskyella sp.]|uniref:VCBS repeat-containing protein n=1 Tax=Winogradskyella sp. TaxID=1883156 RepID=UPI0025EE4A49|nr:VCBS repeat-containing protein [Winogradskyella sp.]
MYYVKRFCLLLIVVFSSCSKTEKETVSSTLFQKVDNNHTNIHFANNVTENLYFNFLNYSYIYNGAGVAVGDINNDGLDDLYFSSNQETNKLYVNKGNLEFKDITVSSNTIDDNGWTTGVSMIDINNDGWLDIYVCKSGSLDNHELRKNKLYINQKDETFMESASEYGLDHFGFSTQAYFFDYDNDNDLDMYLVNHRQDFRNNTHIDPRVQEIKEPYNSDQLFRNDGHRFSNITIEAGIENKAWGLSASIGDFNNDNLLDIYVANDFLEPDFLYINKGNGKFKDEILDHFKHISANSMGSDFADINNDLKPDLIVLDMLAEDHIRSKENMAAMSTENFNLLVDAGYHHQYMSNMLQLNNGNSAFSEIGQLAGIAKTDWSWAPLIADFDNDGYNDLFITNGIENDLSNQDFRNQMKANIQNRKKVSLEQAIDMMPSTKLSNYAFSNNKDLTFTNTTQKWGLDVKINSCGAVYADLDNDGDLDLIVNNQSEEASIYKNNAINNYISFSFKGPENNASGIGTTVNIYSEGLQQSKTLFVSRGYQSSVTSKLYFGLEERTKIDSVRVIWSNKKQQLFTNVEANNNVSLNYKNAIPTKEEKTKSNTLFETVDPNTFGIDYKQVENNFNDFKLQLLLPQKQSEISTPLAVADVNNDGLDDFFVGNSKNEKGSLFIQNKDGQFTSSNEMLFESDKIYEDTNAIFIDVDNDNDMDLYVASGGYEVEQNSPLLLDRLYINNGGGKFKKSNRLPNILSNTKGITSADYDKDGDMDIFVGSRVQHGKYPLSDTSYLLENQNGNFKDVTAERISEISVLKMVNEAVFTDYDNDGDEDLIVVGEWMPITVFENNNAHFAKRELPELKDLNGWYQTIKEVDLDNDGFKDYIIGNWGENNKFHPSEEKPLHVYADDFDSNSSLDIILSKVSKTGELIPVRGKQCSSEQNTFINNKIKTYKEFAASNIIDIYGESELSRATHLTASNFQSIILMNNGNGNFEIKKLPKHAQFSPTLCVEAHDINNDGYLDIFGVGNVFDAEVETIRYDTSRNYVLLGNKNMKFEYSNDASYFNDNEAKAIKKIVINGITHFIIMNKNDKLKILKTRKLI